MSVTFPTRPATRRNGFVAAPGRPARAEHCQCDHDRLIIEPGICFRCGRLLKATISDTWAEQARRHQRRA
ncbi:MAG: hypothetical protein ACRDSS_12910 [Actinocrinis sp.]